eukprot:5364472-Lingulodinium_polyedra.AAC.1
MRQLRCQRCWRLLARGLGRQTSAPCKALQQCLVKAVQLQGGRMASALPPHNDKGPQTAF